MVIVKNYRGEEIEVPEQPLPRNDVGSCNMSSGEGCKATPKKGKTGEIVGYDWEISPDCPYHAAAARQPWNHTIPWNCPTYWDGCNCDGGPYFPDI